jgi:hypothetical protein
MALSLHPRSSLSLCHISNFVPVTFDSVYMAGWPGLNSDSDFICIPGMNPSPGGEYSVLKTINVFS